MSNRRMTKREHARRLARALRSTTERYFAGCLSRASWKIHMRGLWATVERHRLQRLVVKELDPGNFHAQQ